jgi:hypothetical protein
MKHVRKPAAVVEDLVAAVEVEALAAAAEAEEVLAVAVVEGEEAAIAAVVVAEAVGTKDSAKQKDAGPQACVFYYWCVQLTQTQQLARAE